VIFPLLSACISGVDGTIFRIKLYNFLLFLNLIMLVVGSSKLKGVGTILGGNIFILELLLKHPMAQFSMSEC